MKSRHRPPLHLTDPDPEPGAPGDIEGASEPAAVSPEPVPEPAPAPPMSERRRRRLAEEQRQAELRAAEAAARAEAAEAPAATPEIGQSADAPPVAYDPPPAPAPLRRKAEKAPSEGSAYLLAGLSAALWIGGVAAWLAYEIGSGAVELEPLRLAVYALIALAPAGLAIMLAHAIRQGAGLAAETRRARGLSEALIAPTALAAQQTGEVLHSLRNDIDQASLAAERARHDMSLLREALSQETTRLNEAAEVAGRTARRLTEQLGQERDQMQTLGVQLDSQATGVLDAVERQSRMVVDASDLAQTQLREAEAALAARAADLAAAAGEAQDAARIAADDLARQTLRLENAGSGVAEQIQSVEEGLGQQRAALVTAAYALRTDQEDFSAQVESQRAQLTEQLSATRAVTDELGATSARTTESIKDLVEAATDQFRALVEMSQREADGFDSATKLALDKFESLAAEARDALVEETRRALAALQATAEDSRQAAAEAAEQAQVRADRLGEALFEAAQKADQAADARVDSARRIVSETSGLVDETGQRALEQLETTVERMNAALERIDQAMADLDERAARLPQEAQKRVEAVRTSVEDGLAALTAASQKAAADTEALDAGFQERVRRNYDMLTEAVRLMGVVSGDSPTTRRREASAAAAPPPPEPEAPPRQRAERSGESRGFGLRGRLKLAPMPGSGAPAQPEPERLGWNDLVDDRGAEAPLDLDTPVMPTPDGEGAGERITAASQKAAADTEALDAGFQERVRRNYDMLTEAVRLMGVVSGDSPTTRRREASAAAAPPPPEPEAPPRQRAERSGEPRGFGLRGRLKLAPMPGSGAPAQPEPERLGWNDLVDDRGAEAPLDLDTPVMPTPDGEGAGERITAAIRRMGVDPNALLPRSRVEEAAQAVSGGDPDRARQIVRRVAPAAVRSVSRRVLTDPDLRSDAEAYVRSFSRELSERAAAGDEPSVLGRLTSDGGRAYLLLDAAIGDLA